MELRPLKAEDIPALKAIHEAMGLDYPFPDLLGSDVSHVMVVVEDGKVLGCGINILVAETRILLSPTLDPRDKWTAIRLGQAAMNHWAKLHGVRELVAVIPDWLVPKMLKRLKQLQWIESRDGWKLFSRSIK